MAPKQTQVSVFIKSFHSEKDNHLVPNNNIHVTEELAKYLMGYDDCPGIAHFKALGSFFMLLLRSQTMILNHRGFDVHQMASVLEPLVKDSSAILGMIAVDDPFIVQYWNALSSNEAMKGAKDIVDYVIATEKPASPKKFHFMVIAEFFDIAYSKLQIASVEFAISIKRFSPELLESLQIRLESKYNPIVASFINAVQILGPAIEEPSPFLHDILIAADTELLKKELMKDLVQRCKIAADKYQSPIVPKGLAKSKGFLTRFH